MKTVPHIAVNCILGWTVACDSLIFKMRSLCLPSPPKPIRRNILTHVKQAGVIIPEIAILQLFSAIDFAFYWAWIWENTVSARRSRMWLAGIGNLWSPSPMRKLWLVICSWNRGTPPSTSPSNPNFFDISSTSFLRRQRENWVLCVSKLRVSTSIHPSPGSVHSTLCPRLSTLECLILTKHSL